VKLYDRIIKGAYAPAAMNTGKPANDPQEAEKKLEQGVLLEKEGKLDAALECYDAAILLMPGLARAHFCRGNVFLDRGDAASALAAYAKAVELKPDSAAAHYNMGNAHLRLGDAQAAETACRRAITLKPGFSDAHLTLGVALGRLGKQDDAAVSYMRAAELNPDSAELHHSVALSMMEINQPESAISSFDKALALNPDHVDAHHNRGIALQDLNRFEEAAESYRRALEIDPRIAEIHGNLGSALKELGRSEDAIASYCRSLEINPALVDVHYNLGITLQNCGQLDRAVACFTRALAITNGHFDAHIHLGVVLHELGQYESALGHFRQAIELQPRNADGHLNLGIGLAKLGQLDAAVKSYHEALAIQPDNADAHLSLGHALKDLGKSDEGLKCIRRTLEIKPDYALAHSGLLFNYNYVADQPAEQLLADARRFGDMVERLARPFKDWPNSPDPHKPLRVGFVSGDLGSHPVGYFLEGVLAALTSPEASGEIELFAYPTQPHDDEVTKRLRSHCLAWYSAVGLSDEALAQRIREDGIDILVDLSGHTAHNRLPMFAWKPAPVQVSWLGYFATTGVAAMDYFIADPWTLPPEQEAYFSERIWRLPETRLCFTPPDAQLEVNALPALGNGCVTFGCFNNLSKMNDAVVALWARVLHAVPGSRLFLKYQQLGEVSVRQRTCERFAAHGIDSGRLIFEGYVPRGSYLQAYHRVDIGLDPFPFPGGTTTVEALWMGVPVLTLQGERFLSRQGVGLLMNAGLPDWIAADADDYVARAVAHAQNLNALAALRTSLRSHVLASPIFDAPRFAAHLEAAFRAMWVNWCEERKDGTPG